MRPPTSAVTADALDEAATLGARLVEEAGSRVRGALAGLAERPRGLTEDPGVLPAAPSEASREVHSSGPGEGHSWRPARLCGRGVYVYNRTPYCHRPVAKTLGDVSLRLPVGPARFLKTRYIIAAFVAAFFALASITGFVWAEKSVTLVVDGASKTRDHRESPTSPPCSGRRASMSARVISSAPTHPRPSSTARVVVVRHAIPVTLRAGRRVDLPEGPRPHRRRRARDGGPRSHGRPATDPAVDCATRGRA